jgi:hypothetical protein
VKTSRAHAVSVHERRGAMGKRIEAAKIEHCQCWLLSSELSWKNRDLRTFGSSLPAMEVVAVRPSAASDAVTSREVKSKTGWPKSIKWKLPSSDQSFAGHRLLAGLGL